MRYLYLLCLLLGSTMLSAQETITGTIVHDGIERDYRLRVPSASDEAMPLVFNLHGFGSNAFEQELYAQMNPVADTAGFFVCYPQGVSNAWNVGWAFGSTADDVGFISALIDTLSANYNIDHNRVYSCGMSNGGFMSYRLACELSGRVAAVASVTGSMAPGTLQQCEPGEAVPVLEIHGTEDDVVAYEGTVNVSLPIPEILSFWADNNGCAETPAEEELPNTSITDASTVTKITYTDCTDAQEVLHYRVNGGGHTWPGADFAIGVTNQDIDASVEIWHFFNRFTLDDITSTAEPVSLSTLEATFAPNPVQDMGTLTLNQPYAYYRLLGLSGTVYQEGAHGSGNTIDFSALNTGIYFLEVLSADGGRQVLKIAKM